VSGARQLALKMPAILNYVIASATKQSPDFGGEIASLLSQHLRRTASAGVTSHNENCCQNAMTI
jgi:hypothetical protein